MPQEKLRLKDANFSKENTKSSFNWRLCRSFEFHLNEEIKKNDLSLHRFSTALYLKNFNFSNKKTEKYLKIIH